MKMGRRAITKLLWTALVVMLISHGQTALAGLARYVPNQYDCEPAYQPKKRALLAGAHQYRFIREGGLLQGPQNDVRLIENALKPLGFDVQVVSDGKASKSTVLAAWESMAKDAKCGDQVFLMLSGHGIIGSDTNWHFLLEDAKPQALTDEAVQAGDWSDAELYQSINQLRAKKANVSVLIDAAESERARLFAAPHAGLALTSEKWDFAPRYYGALSVIYAHGIHPEMLLPLGQPSRKPYGLLSYLVGQAMLSGATTPSEFVSYVNEKAPARNPNSDNRYVKANYATTHPDLPFFHVGPVDTPLRAYFSRLDRP